MVPSHKEWYRPLVKRSGKVFLRLHMGASTGICRIISRFQYAIFQVPPPTLPRENSVFEQFRARTFFLVWLPPAGGWQFLVFSENDWKCLFSRAIIFWKKGVSKKAPKHKGLMHMARVEETL